MKILDFLIPLILAFSFTSIPIQTVVAISMPVTTDVAISDTFVDSDSPNTALDYVHRNYIGISEGGYTYRSLLLFDVSAYTGITEAILNISVMRISGGGCPAARIHIITSSWGESTVTWNSQPTYDVLTNATIDLSATNHPEANITELVQDWRSGSVINYGILIEQDDLSVDSYAETGSRTDDAANQPHLIITYIALVEQIHWLIIPFVMLIPIILIKKRN